MKRIPFAIFSSIIGIGYLAKIWNPSLFFWTAMGAMMFVAISYVLSMLNVKSKVFHEYIGWTWTVIPIFLSWNFIMNKYTSWNRWGLFVIGLSVGIVLIYLWLRNEENKTESVSFFNLIAILLIATSVGACIMSVNESKIRQFEFYEVKVIDMPVFESTHTLTDHKSYSIVIEKESQFYNLREFSISEEYYRSIELDDSIFICVCTGALGEQFCFLYNDPSSAFDFYGLNDWATEQAKIQGIS